VETDGVRQTMFSQGPMLARDNGSRVSCTESGYTARYQDLLIARTGVQYCRT